MYSPFLFFAHVSCIRDTCHLCPVVTVPSMEGVPHLPQCAAVSRSALLSLGDSVTQQTVQVPRQHCVRFQETL